jgi:hypothetical protein
VYHQVRTPHYASRTPDYSSRLGAEALTRSALARVRKIVSAYLPGMYYDPATLTARLNNPLTDPVLEAERFIALGWLQWLAGEFAAAAPLFDQAVNGARALIGIDQLAEAAYWRARVGLLCEVPDALAGYEGLLRSFGGSPQATAWFVDLLWRSGRVDRAEQVWRSVRGNRKVTACDEWPLLEARSALRHGEVANALKTLDNSLPSGGVAQVERLLLRAWALAEQKHYDRAEAAWQEAASGPYPASALRSWREQLEWRKSGSGNALQESAAIPPAFRELHRGYRARVSQERDQAVTAFQAAIAEPAAQAFARFALATLGLADPGDVLHSQPGLFLTVRARLWQIRERFRRREAMPVEFLAAVQQAAAQHYTAHAAVEPFGTLAAALEEHNLAVLEPFMNQGDPAVRRNGLRAHAELVVQDLPAKQAVTRLLSMAQGEEDVDLRIIFGRLALRLLFKACANEGGPVVGQVSEPASGLEGLETFPTTEGFLGEVTVSLTALLPQEPLLELLGNPPAEAEAAPAAVRLARLAAELHKGDNAEGGVSDADRWCELVRASGEGSLRGLALALLVVDAGKRHDAERVLDLLSDLEAWRGFRPGPPLFAVRAVAATATANPSHPGWRTKLPPWLALWGVPALGGVGTILAGFASVAIVDALLEPPPGTPAVRWFLHRAVRALEQDDPCAALVCVRRALAVDPELTAVPAAAMLRAALPDLERRARAQALANALNPMRGLSIGSALLVDMVDLLQSLPDGSSLLDSPVPREMLADRADLPPRLSHHLALADTRAALFLEGQGGQAEDALACWRRAWDHWLRFLASAEAPENGASVLTAHLLAGHRRRLTALLARADVDEARGTWQLVQALPQRATELAPGLATLLGERVERWRDDLATEFLLSTREAMRFGDVPDGLHADYERGLAALRRHLSLDHDNVRLLTALVEICSEWFLDLYHAPDRGDLGEVVACFTPFAQQLARLVEGRPGELLARAVLADYWKFRGFVTSDGNRKRALYEEALRFNPSNSNVRELLAGLDEKAE